MGVPLFGRTPSSTEKSTGKEKKTERKHCKVNKSKVDSISSAAAISRTGDKRSNAGKPTSVDDIGSTAASSRTGGRCNSIGEASSLDNISSAATISRTGGKRSNDVKASSVVNIGRTAAISRTSDKRSSTQRLHDTGSTDAATAANSESSV